MRGSVVYIVCPVPLALIVPEEYFMSFPVGMIASRSFSRMMISNIS